MEQKEYNVLSPDGFSINYSGTYDSIEKAENAIKEWVKNYEKQGYYSTIKNGERLCIPISELADHCQIVTIEKSLSEAIGNNHTYDDDLPF